MLPLDKKYDQGVYMTFRYITYSHIILRPDALRAFGKGKGEEWHGCGRHPCPAAPYT
jgi:hypothetical protein